MIMIIPALLLLPAQCQPTDCTHTCFDTPRAAAILIRKSVNRAGPGMGYGFVCAFCFCLAFFCLLCGLVLDGFSDVVRDQLEVKLAGRWTKYNTGEFAATTGFAYICFVMFMLFFVALLMFQGAVAEELSTLPTLRPGAGFNPYARMAVPAAMESQGAMPSGMMVNPVYAPYPLAMDPAAAAAAAALIQGGGLGLGGAKVPLPGAAGVREQVPSAAALGADPAGAL